MGKDDEKITPIVRKSFVIAFFILSVWYTP
jgi:hypothetical protein